MTDVPEGYKICSKCEDKTPKPLSEFHHYTNKKTGKVLVRPECKVCNREMSRSYKARNRDKVSGYNKIYKAENKEEISRYNHDYNKNNREAIQKRQTKQHRERKEKDPNYKVRNRLGTTLYYAIKNKHDNKCMQLVGCSYRDLEYWLECQFEPSMSMKNFGKVWSIDHINPCCNFDLTDEDNVSVCFHWSNLKPVFRLDNQRKTGKVIKSEIKEHHKIAKLFINILDNNNIGHNYELLEI